MSSQRVRADSLAPVSLIPADSVVVPPSLRAVAARVEARLAPVLDAEIRRWEQLDAALAEPLASLRDLVLSDAKRIRPAFCYWGHIAAGGAPDDDMVVDIGAALELLQAFALVHDDVMDGSAIRRGRRTAHLTFADEHLQGEWSGEARRFGEGVAILIGDLAHVFADRLMVGTSIEVRQVWDELRVELNVGQYLDLLGTARADIDLARSRRIARYKSGKYTIERPLHLGAASAGALDRLAPLLSAYGDPLGEAFQLRDDLLGAFGDTLRTGKPVGEDLREGKPTVLLAEADTRASAAQRTVMQLVGRPDLDARELEDIQSVLIETGAKGAVEQRVLDLADRAIASLDGVPLPGGATEALTQLAWYVARREV